MKNDACNTVQRAGLCLYLCKTEALSMLSRPDYIKSFLHHFPPFNGRCSVYRTPAVARLSGFVPYKELPPFEG